MSKTKNQFAKQVQWLGGRFSNPQLHKAVDVSCYCMANDLSSLIDILKKNTIISSRPDLSAALTSIDKFSDNDYTKAYLLGNFFKYKLDSDRLSPDEKSNLLNTIKRKNLDKYFYLKANPTKNDLGFIVYIFIIVGLIAIIAGTVQLKNGTFSYGIGTKYLVPIIREGGYKIILGLVLFIGGLVRLEHERKKQKFLSSFFDSPNNSN